MAAGNSFGDIYKGAHVVGAGAADEVAKGAFVTVADRLEVIELGVSGD